MITPQLEAARTALDELEARTQAEREKLDKQMALAREVQSTWANHEGAVIHARNDVRNARSKVEILKARLQKACREIATMAPEYEFSGDYFVSSQGDPMEDNMGLFLKWNGRNPFIHYGSEIAGCESAIGVLQKLLVTLEDKERKARAAAREFAVEHGINPEPEFI